jgi:tetratricopeptide (TPR) repeat protein
VPTGIDKQYNPADMRHNLALSFAHQNRFQEAVACWNEALGFDPDSPEIHYRLAMALAAQGDITDTLKHYNRAVKLQPDIDTSVGLHDRLAVSYARAGNFTEAIRSARKAVELARAAGESEVAFQIEQRIERYRQQRPSTSE